MNLDGSSSEEDPHIVEAKRRSRIFNTGSRQCPYAADFKSGQTGTVQISNGDLVTATFGKEEEAEIDHPGASRHHGQIWVSLSDMQPGVYAGERVQFRLYAERKGLGGENWSEGARACREILQRNIV